MRTSRRGVFLFAAFFLLAGVANLLSRTGIPVFDGLMTGLNYLIHTGLLLFWFQSVRARLLPSRAKAWVIFAALLMLLYQLLRVFKYRFAVDPAAQRYLVYLYFAPMTLIPTLFLMTCLRIRVGSRAGRPDEALLLIPPCLLALVALTNDLHALVYVPRVALSEFAVNSGTYGRGPFFYAFYAWMILSFSLGLFLLFREKSLRRGKAFLSLLAVLALWFALIASYNSFFDGTVRPRMYNNPDIHTFGMLGVFEVCIRRRLIPHNANYADFFAALRVPALVTDRDFHPAYRSGGAFPVGTDQLRASLSSPVYLTPDWKLSGREVRGGLAFWAEDEAEVHRAQERQAEANDLLDSENTLIRAEAEQREKDAYLQSRHRIYHEIAEAMYPCQQRIADLLGRMVPGSPSFRDQLAFVSVLNAYVKRKSNLLLLAAEKESLTAHDLFLALEESASYLSLAGLQAGVREAARRSWPADLVIALYDAFEAVAEQLVGSASSLMVSLRGSGLILAADASRAPVVEGLPVPVRTREEEGVLYIDLLAEKGGERT